MKLTQEDLNKLNLLKDNKETFLKELGQIKYNEILLDERNDKALDFFEKLKQQEKSIIKELEEKYGRGAVNVETGEFTPE
tara:strand:- start:808 stop:1047 length:240 start_codon:yes stop_codon:yes gene_type:complete